MERLGRGPACPPLILTAQGQGVRLICTDGERSCSPDHTLSILCNWKEYRFTRDTCWTATGRNHYLYRAQLFDMIGYCFYFYRYCSCCCYWCYFCFGYWQFALALALFLVLLWWFWWRRWQRRRARSDRDCRRGGLHGDRRHRQGGPERFPGIQQR